LFVTGLSHPYGLAAVCFYYHFRVGSAYTAIIYRWMQAEILCLRRREKEAEKGRKMAETA
jgi:hypothetical protein